MVAQGQVIAYASCTGWDGGGPHLHFEVNMDGHTGSNDTGYTFSSIPAPFVEVVSNNGFLLRGDSVVSRNVLQSAIERVRGPAAGRFSVRVSPNPLSPGTAVRITLPAQGVLSYAVYDLGGKLVRAFKPGPDKAPVIVWNGCDGQGRPLASGVYLGRLVLEKGKALEHRLVILR
jgi:murein DD-endopeptidase MepM/ murein hydrolase activator NlpD